MMRFAALEKAAPSKAREEQAPASPLGMGICPANLLDLPGLAMRAENQKSHPQGWLF